MVSINYLPDYLAKNIVDKINEKGWKIHECHGGLILPKLFSLRSIKEKPAEKIELNTFYFIFPKINKIDELSDALTFLHTKEIYSKIIEWVDFVTTSKEVLFLHHKNNDIYSLSELSDIVENVFPDINNIMKEFPLYIETQQAIQRGDQDQIF